MNFRKSISIFVTSTLVLALADAATITLQASDGPVTINVPDDLAPLIEQNKGKIEESLKSNSVTSSTVSGYETQITQVYDDYKAKYPNATSPFTDTVGNLNVLCDELVDTIPNTQGIQNIYADAWIGKLIPSAHFGAGVNVGASSLDISSLKKTASALDINVGDIPDNLAFPTINADLRVGGILLPFDIGIAVMKFDSSTIGALEKAIDPMSFDYFVIGGDFRYALLKGGMLKPKVSIGAGYYYTSGNLSVKNDQASASLGFSSQAYLLEAQASIKLLFLIPFVGTKLIYSKTDVDWTVDAQWKNIITTGASDFGNMVDQGIIPSHFSGKSNSTSFHPQVFGGVGFDFFVLSATVSLGYDIKSKIVSGAVSTRLSW